MLDPKKLAIYATNPVAFRNDVMIEIAGGTVPLGSVLDPWQDADFRAADPGWLQAMGHRVDGLSRTYSERPRGHSKTQDQSISAAHALFFAPKKIMGVSAAADADQGRLLADAIDRLLRCNPLLANVLEVQRNTVVNQQTGSELRIISSDVGSSYGLLCDFITIDELTHWTAAGEGLWHSLLSTAAKKPTCMLAIISNAGLGMGESWQWKVREAARLSDRWHFSRLDGPVASWMTPAILEEMRQILPPGPWRRLFGNEWSLSSGDALEDADIQAAITQDGPMTGQERDVVFIGGLDLSVKRDHSALVVVAVNGNTRRIRLAGCWSWAPRPGGQIDLQEIEATVLAVHQRFRLRSLSFDPHQAQLLVQRCQSRGLQTIEVPFVGKNLNAMASGLLQFFRERRIDIYDEPALVKDLRKLVIVEKQFGLKLEAPSSIDGHADRAFALAVLIIEAARIATTSTRSTTPWHGLNGMRGVRNPLPSREQITNFF